MSAPRTLLTTAIALVLLTTIPILPTPTITATPTFPSSFTWRDINGTDYTTPIKDQSPAPTCEGYAICAALETKVRYALHAQTIPDLSEAHIYFYAGGTIAQGYVNLQDAANYLKTYGVPDEGCFPDPHRPADFTYQSLPGWQNRTVKITDWGWIAHDIDTIKQNLITHGPLVVCIHFPNDFFNYRHGVYTPGPGQIVGGHVVALVGYDDANSCWILKNSWGTRWGEDGWFRLSYSANIFSSWYRTRDRHHVPRRRLRQPQTQRPHHQLRHAPQLQDLPLRPRISYHRPQTPLNRTRCRTILRKRRHHRDYDQRDQRLLLP